VQTRCEAATASTPAVQAEDKWLARNVVPLVSSSSNRCGLSAAAWFCTHGMQLRPPTKAYCVRTKPCT
jgi:hypothetical protein